MIKLSPYTIASNCTDITDCNDGIDEIYEAYDRYDRLHKKAPLYLFIRLEKLRAKRDKCSLKEHGMKYDDYLLSRDLGKTDKRNKISTVFISFKKKDVRRSQNLVPNEHGHLICAFDSRPRYATAITRESNHLSGAKLDDLGELRKKFDKKIKQWENAKTLNVEDFMLFIALELRLRASKKNDKHFSYYLALFDAGDKYVLRISDHHFDASTAEPTKAKHTTAITFSNNTVESWDVFKSDPIMQATEYVYYEGNVGKDELIAIAKDIVSFVETGKFNPSVKPNEINYSPNKENLGSYVSNFVNDCKKTNEKLKNALSTETGTFAFAEHISELYGQGEKLDWLKAKKIAKDFDIETETEIMQACELGVVLEARRIANNGNSLRQQYEEMKDLYERQVTIRPLDTKSKVLQQYSTPCPLAYLLGKFVTSGKQDGFSANIYLEPSAGNGMLTIALPKKNTYVNELDEIRVENLKKQGFAEVTNFDASVSENIKGRYKGVITNPPFAELKVSEYLSRTGKKGNNNIQYVFQKLDHKMAIVALESMKSDGRCAIIIGGKIGSRIMRHEESYWRNGRLFGAFNTFVSYLNRQYNLVDILYINGDLYGRQGTTFPIVALLIDGRKEWDSEPTTQWHTYDIAVDAQINSYEELYQRMIKHIEPGQSNSVDIKRKRAMALMLKMKMAIIKDNIKNNIL